MSTKIEWCDEVWNPVTGCTPILPECKNCYAKRMAYRLRGRFGYPQDDPFRLTFHPDRIAQPSKWKKPRRIFVCSMGDLFHEKNNVVEQAIIWGTMRRNPQHTFLVLTKRPKWMAKFLILWNSTDSWDSKDPVLHNAWLGTSITCEAVKIKRLKWLLKCQAFIRFVSVEPMLGPVDLSPVLHDIDWVICGAETGPGRRPMDLDWARRLRDQCIAADVPFFFKKDSNGNRELDGQRLEQFPEV